MWPTCSGWCWIPSQHGQPPFLFLVRTHLESLSLDGSGLDSTAVPLDIAPVLSTALDKEPDAGVLDAPVGVLFCQRKPRLRPEFCFAYLESVDNTDDDAGLPEEEVPFVTGVLLPTPTEEGVGGTGTESVVETGGARL